MRLHKLRFKNINSLAGEYEIDFDAPEYAESGIFAITGPTGSGKTTILDAAALALYGKTPRTTSVSEGSKAEPFFFLTKGRDDCYAQAVFDVRGQYYLSRWSVAKKRRAEGFQQPKAELAALDGPDDSEGRVLAEKINDWRAAVEKILGMDFEAFTRCVLLAQGAFTSFLRAPVKKRSEILERITGTQIYSEIGKAVFRRMREAEAAWQRLEDAVKAAPPLSNEERQALEAALSGAQAEAAGVAEESKALEAACRWLDESEKAARESEAAANAREAAAAEAQKAAPLAAKAAAARRALLPMARVEALAELKKKAGAERDKAAQAQAAALAAKRDAEAAGEKAAALAQVADAAQKKADDFRPQSIEMAAADGRIGKLVEAADEARRRSAAAARAAKAAQAEGAEKTAEAKAAAEALAKLEADLRAGAADDQIAPLLPGLAQAVDAHRAKKLAAVASGKVAAAALAKRDAAAKQLAEAAAVAADASKRRGDAAAKAAEARRTHEVAMAGSSLEKALLSLKHAEDAWWSARWLLQLGREAALAREAMAAAAARPAGNEGLAAYAGGVAKRCGEAAEALLADFPELARGLTPERAAELKAAADGIRDWSKRAGASEGALREAEAALRRADDTAQKAAAGEREAQAALAPAEQALAGALAKKAADAASLEEARAGYLEKAGVFFEKATLLRMKPAEVLRTLEARSAARRQALAAREDALAKAASLAQAAAAAEAKREAAQKTAEELEGAAREAASAAEKAAAERRERWGDVDGAAQMKALDAALRRAQQAKDRAEAALSKAREELAGAEASAKKTLEAAEAAEAQAAAEAPKTEAAVRAAGFESEAALAQAYLPEAQILEAEGAERQARESLAAAEALAKKRAEALAEVLARRVTDEAPEAVRARAKAAAAKLLEANQAIGRLAEQRRADDRRREEAAEKRREADAAEKRYRDWGELSSLIGSASGDVFRRAAQKLTFRVLLATANQALDQMQSRYELRPSGELGLDVDVVDRFLMGTPRTSFNLSGGETFLVSLALALSLSRITTRGLQVDTLFLDEGFGSLDAETLDRALEALENLQQSSRKLVGLISHVAAVRERIPTHIAVRPRAQGESDIEGPGVRRLC